MPIVRRILLADDDRQVRIGVADLLGGLGLEVLHAETGTEALEIVRRCTLDAVLLDLHMPGCGGIEALPIIHQSRLHLPCIVYSGSFTAELEQHALQAGAFAVLRKPVQPQMLRDEVRRALEFKAG